MEHQNKVEVERTERNVFKLEITNYLASIKEGKIVKALEIRFEDRIIKVLDSFSPSIFQ